MLKSLLKNKFFMPLILIPQTIQFLVILSVSGHDIIQDKLSSTWNTSDGDNMMRDLSKKRYLTSY